MKRQKHCNDWNRRNFSILPVLSHRYLFAWEKFLRRGTIFALHYQLVPRTRLIAVLTASEKRVIDWGGRIWTLIDVIFAWRAIRTHILTERLMEFIWTAQLLPNFHGDCNVIVVWISELQVTLLRAGSLNYRLPD